LRKGLTRALGNGVERAGAAPAAGGRAAQGGGGALFCSPWGHRRRLIRTPPAQGQLPAVVAIMRRRTTRCRAPPPLAHLSWSATFSMPALKQASYLSPPGEPGTTTAPIHASTHMIGSATR